MVVVVAVEGERHFLICGRLPVPDREGGLELNEDEGVVAVEGERHFLICEHLPDWEGGQELNEDELDDQNHCQWRWWMGNHAERLG